MRRGYRCWFLRTYSPFLKRTPSWRISPEPLRMPCELLSFEFSRITRWSRDLTSNRFGWIITRLSPVKQWMHPSHFSHSCQDFNGYLTVVSPLPLHFLHRKTFLQNQNAIRFTNQWESSRTCLSFYRNNSLSLSLFVYEHNYWIILRVKAFPQLQNHVEGS